MRGIVDFYEDGENVGHAENLITTAGKSAILRYLAKMTTDYAGAMVVGLDTTTAVVGDIKLGIETSKIPVIMRSVDYANQTITFKATLEQGFAGKIYEMGLATLLRDGVTGTYTSKIISAFDPTETWIKNTNDGSIITTVADTNSRVGTGVLNDTIKTNSAMVEYEVVKNLDLGGYSATDQISFGHISYSNRLTSLVVTFTDFQGYTASVTQNVTTHAAGDGVVQYNIYRVNKSGFTTSNALFNWSGIVKVKVRTNAGATAGSTPFGPGSWDFLGIIDIDTLDPDYVLVTHVSQASPIATKTAGRVMDIEYKLVFNL